MAQAAIIIRFWQEHPQRFKRLSYMGKAPHSSGGLPAQLGSLPPEIYRVMSKFRDLAVMREEALADLIGTRQNKSHLRECILRQLFIAFARREVLRISDYQRLCKRFGSAPVIRTEIARLEAKKVLVLRSNPTDSRMIEVWPTERTVAWVLRGVPKIAGAIKGLFADL
jgi:hypothetical protein